MSSLPVMLRVVGRRCVVVGGGAVACRRAGALHEAGAQVVVIGSDIEDRVASLAHRVHRRAYQPGDLESACLVVVATDDPAVNQAVAQEAQERGIWVNRADDPVRGDLIIPAHVHHGPVTLAVSTGGISASGAGAIRRELSDALDPDWPRLLEIVAPFRQTIQQQATDPQQRRACLLALTDPQAMATLKLDGPDALRCRCQGLVDRLPDVDLQG